MAFWTTQEPSAFESHLFSQEVVILAQYDILVKGGRVVRGNGVRLEDIAVKGETVAKLAPDINPKEATETIDASGKLIFPGILDVHTHPVYVDDLGGTSVTAAFGGITTLIHYAYARPGMKLTETVQRFKEEGLQKSLLDFGLHGGIFDAPNQVKEIPETMKMGVTSFKFFMTYAKLKWMTDDYYLAAAMDLLAQNGGLAMVHAESALAIDYLEDKYLKSGEPQKDVFLKTRPDALEAEATFRAICIAEVMECPLYIAHVTAGRGIPPIRRAKEAGQTVYAETCPQYLALTDDQVRTKGPLAKIGPPLRTRQDNDALWAAIEEGVIDVIASDHAPKSKKVDDDFFEAPFGSPSSETLLTVSHDEGVNGAKIDLCRLVRVLSENPARIFGLFPKKGAIQEESDADLVLFDPTLRLVISQEAQHSNAPYTLYEGRSCLGVPVLTMQRGSVIIQGNRIRMEPGSSNFLATSIHRG
jgi:dihydropyrimidinase